MKSSFITEDNNHNLIDQISSLKIGPKLLIYIFINFLNFNGNISFLLCSKFIKEIGIIYILLINIFIIYCSYFFQNQIKIKNIHKNFCSIFEENFGSFCAKTIEIIVNLFLYCNIFFIFILLKVVFNKYEKFYNFLIYFLFSIIFILITFIFNKFEIKNIFYISNFLSFLIKFYNIYYFISNFKFEKDNFKIKINNFNNFKLTFLIFSSFYNNNLIYYWINNQFIKSKYDNSYKKKFKLIVFIFNFIYVVLYILGSQKKNLFEFKILETKDKIFFSLLIIDTILYIIFYNNLFEKKIIRKNFDNFNFTFKFVMILVIICLSIIIEANIKNKENILLYLIYIINILLCILNWGLPTLFIIKYKLTRNIYLTIIIIFLFTTISWSALLKSIDNNL